MIEIRTGQAPAVLSRQAFGERYRASFADPTYALSVEWLASRQAIDRAQLA